MLDLHLAPRAPLLAPRKAPPVEWVVTPGLTQYPDALAEMEARSEAIARGEAAERVWLIEHPPLYTAGTSAKDATSSTRVFRSIAPAAAASSPITGPGSGWPMSCSTSGAAAPTFAPMLRRLKAG